MRSEAALRSKPHFSRSDVVGYTSDAAVGIFGQHVLLLWRRRITMPPLRWVKDAFDEVAGVQGRKIVFLTMIEKPCDLSTPADVRKEIAAFLKNHESNIGCAAIVFEDGGFKMTIIRSVITAINMASRSRFPNAVFATVDAALRWINTIPIPGEVPAEPGSVTAAVDALRAL